MCKYVLCPAARITLSPPHWGRRQPPREREGQKQCPQYKNFSSIISLRYALNISFQIQIMTSLSTCNNVQKHNCGLRKFCEKPA